MELPSLTQINRQHVDNRNAALKITNISNKLIFKLLPKSKSILNFSFFDGYTLIMELASRRSSKTS